MIFGIFLPQIVLAPSPDLPFLDPFPEVARNANLVEYPGHEGRTLGAGPVEAVEGTFVPKMGRGKGEGDRDESDQKGVIDWREK